MPHWGPGRVTCTLPRLVCPAGAQLSRDFCAIPPSALMGIIPAALSSCVRSLLLQSSAPRLPPHPPSSPHTQTQLLISNAFIYCKGTPDPALCSSPSSSRRPREVSFQRVHARGSGLPHQGPGLKTNRHEGWRKLRGSCGRCWGRGAAQGAEMSSSTGRRAGPSRSPGRESGVLCNENIITPKTCPNSGRAEL